MIWRLTYCNKEGVEARIDIIRGNRTPVEVVQGSGQPFTLSYKLDKNDKSGHIMTSSADIEIFETETFNIDDLKTSNETELKVEYFEDDILTWSGFILPDFFSREIGSPNIVRMTASDRLTALKGVTLSDLSSKVSLRDLIELSLAQTGLGLGLVSQIQINQDSINILDSEILSQRFTDVKGRSISCYDILMSIMVGTNSTIRQRAGQWQVYNKLEHELRTPTIFFDKVERGAIRTIQPVASSVGVYNEFGGNRLHPNNYDFSLGLANWTSRNGFEAYIDNRVVSSFLGGTPIYQPEVTTNDYLVNFNNWITNETNLDTAPFLESNNIPIASTQSNTVEVEVDISAVMAEKLSSSTAISFLRYAIIATNGVDTYALTTNGLFEAYDPENINEHSIILAGGQQPPLLLASPAYTNSSKRKGVLEVNNVNDFHINIRIYGSSFEQYVNVNFASVRFGNKTETPKGNLYKTTQGSNYTKLHDVETVIFGDYIRKGLNGYFYDYPIDETSNLYLPNGELSDPTWITAFDATERPLLHHISRQKSSLFSVAHDILKANINVESFDPLAVFQDCKGGKYVVVSANFDFLRSEVDVELEQIAYDNTILKRDYIYSYFGEGEDTIKSIGGIAGGGGTGGGGGGGMTNDQVAILNDVAKLAHLHENKEIIDQITQDMVDNASHEIVISTDTETELTDENILSALRVLSEITKNNETFLEDLKEQFLSKINPDTAQKLITFIEGIEVGTFTTGALGSGAAVKMVDGTSYAEVDNLTVRQKATFRELIIESLKHIGGQLVLTPARMKCVRVVDGGTYFKCYFDTGDGEVSNEFVAGDFARCQVFTGSGTKFYWRLVTLVGDDWINLSKTSAAVGSDAPEAGDDITQLGNATDTTRQSAIILSTVGIDAPSWKQYSGINSFSLEGKETTVFSKLGNRISGETVFTSGGANLDDYLDGVAQDILDALQAAQDAEDKAQQAIEDAEADVAILNTEIGRLQDQIDGKVSNWYYAYSPTLSNYPASDWTTNEIKDAHIGDTFTNTEPIPAENAGKSWRFIKDGSTYSWIVISDSDALKALQEASKAQATADGKSTTYLFQPTKYKLGDMWVLNADQTVNGTAYKQGDLLTATQDSETFVQAHWLKRVRYTDDTAIDNLEIGGRNLIIEQESQSGYIAAGDGSFNYRPNGGDNRDQHSGYIKVDNNTTYTYSTHIVGEQVGENINRRLFFYNENKEYLGSGEVLTSSDREARITFTPPQNARYIGVYTSDGYLSGGGTKPKLEKGNKATDWTPAPEDVEADIDTAIDNIEIGGRNLILNTSNSYKDITATGIVDVLQSPKPPPQETNVIFRAVIDNKTVNNSDRVRIRLKLNTSTGGRRDLYSEWVEVGSVGVIEIKTNTANYDGVIQIYGHSEGSSEYTFRWKELKLEKGTKATDWTPAPEDTQAEIDAAKKAGTDASAEVVAMGSSLSSMVTNVTEALEDKVIDEAERKTLIAEQKTLDTEQERLLALVNSLLGSAYLVGDANTALSDASDVTLKAATGTLDIYQMTIDVMINADKITAAMISAYEGAYDDHKNGLSSLNVAIENARKAIDIEVKRLSDEKVDNLEIGGRNLLINSNIFTTGWVIPSDVQVIRTPDQVVPEWEATDATRIETVGGSANIKFYKRVGNPLVDDTRIISIWVKNDSDSNLNIQFNAGTVLSGSSSLSLESGFSGRVIYNVKYSGIGNLQFQFRAPSAEDSLDFTVWRMQVEKGNKATDWTPAPEDVQAEIDGAKQEAEDARAEAQALDYLKQAIGEDPIINGALFTLVTILLKERMDADVTAGISGLQGAAKNLPAFWAGGTDVQAQQGTAKAIIRHDGSSKFSDTEITGIINALSGYIGGLTIKDGKLLIGNVGDNRIELDPSSRRIIFTTYDDFNSGSIGFDAEGALLNLYKRTTGSMNYSASVSVDGYSILLSRLGPTGNQIDSVTISPSNVMVSNASNTTEVRADGIYKNGIKVL